MKHENNLISAVCIPALQALISALLAGSVVYIAASLLRVPERLLMALGAFGVIALYSWLSYRAEWRARLSGEEASSQPLPPVVKELRLKALSEDGRAGDYFYLDGMSLEQLSTLARGVLAGRSLAVHEWSGLHRPFTRSQFENLRGQLLERGFIRARSESAPQLGYELSSKGRALMRALAEQQPAPSPTRLRLSLK